MYHLTIFLLILVHDGNAQNTTFPSDFKFGVATSAYQVEGGWNASNKGPSMWDTFTHNTDLVKDVTTGDDACLSYFKVDEDIQLLKKLKVDIYRFSISWPRIFPNGFTNQRNPEGVRYYNELIDKLIANGIEPIVTIYHWDLPQSIHEIGGWTNPHTADYLTDFARTAYQLFGDRVKTWITINEPYSICQMGYGLGALAPYLHSDGIGAYQCGYTLLIAHAKMYRLYVNEFKAKQGGKVGITIETSWWEANNRMSDDDSQAAERMMDMYFGWFAQPIFSKRGNYPVFMRRRIDAYSKLQNYTQSRLPPLSSSDIKLVQGTADFLGLNHYTTYYCTLTDDQSPDDTPSFMNDAGVTTFYDATWPETARSTVRSVPWGLRNLLNYIKNVYNNVEVMITENGYAGYPDEDLNDTGRVDYYNGYLSELRDAINEDNCHVTAYIAWSFLDNFEWTDGYTMKFGLFNVNFTDPDRTRTPKQSAFAYQNVIVTRQVYDNVTFDDFPY